MRVMARRTDGVTGHPAARARAAPQPRVLGNQARLRRIQAQLTVGAVNDPLEHEADAVADSVMRQAGAAPGLGAAPPRISRKCAACEEDAGPVRTKREGVDATGGVAPASVDDVLNAPGEPLDAATRAFFEPKFGHDFSGVRVHRDERAGRSAREIDARAYAMQQHIVFASGAYAPGNSAGRRLLAHELTHVVQQGHGGPANVQRETPTPAPAPPPVTTPDAGGAPAAAPVAGVACPPTATVIAKTLSEYVDLMKCAEAKTALPPRDMLTMFRQLYYGSQSWSVSSNPVWDDVVKCPRPVGDPRPLLGTPLFASLQASQEVAGVDVGHVFVGLEATMCPTADVTASQTVAGIHPSVSMSNEDFATWGGDLGAAVAAYIACPAQGAAATTKDDCFHLPGTSSIFDFLAASAPDQDLQGDIDAFALRAQGLGIPCGGSAQKAAALPAGNLSAVFQDYYNNSGSALGKAHANNARCFLDALGATLDPTGKSITNLDMIAKRYQPNIADFALAFSYKISGSKAAAFGSFGANIAGGGPMFTKSETAMRWFLRWLEAKL